MRLVWIVTIACGGFAWGPAVSGPLFDFRPLPDAPRLEYVTLTAYSSEISQTDSTPFITASGTRTRTGVIALSRDLLARYPFGTKARLVSHDCGRSLDIPLVVEDTMHRRKRRQVDIWMPSTEQALQWGRCTGWILFEE